VSADIRYSVASIDLFIVILVESAVVNEVAGMWDLDLIDELTVCFFVANGLNPDRFD